MKNQVQFQKGYSLIDYIKDYGTEEQCRKALFLWRWPQGYKCPECDRKSYFTLKEQAVFQCNRCHHQHLILFRLFYKFCVLFSVAGSNNEI
jgi:DNA-directed RNA polymerase subunit RPC12/RpoP